MVTVFTRRSQHDLIAIEARVQTVSQIDFFLSAQCAIPSSTLLPFADNS